jgi:hypothetical protein
VNPVIVSGRYTQMKRHNPIVPLRLERFAWMVAVVVVLRFAAWDLHHVFDLHAADEPCEICLVVERGGDGPVAVAARILLPHTSPAPRAAFSAPHRATPAPCPLPRGPPTLLG